MHTHLQVVAIIQTMVVVAFLAWSMYVWVNVDTFGSSPECNANVKYVLSSVRATASWLRMIWIISLGICGGVMVMAVIIAISLTSSRGNVGSREMQLKLEPGMKL